MPLRGPTSRCSSAAKLVCISAVGNELLEWQLRCKWSSLERAMTFLRTHVL